MLILLPPSENKAPGGSGAPLAAAGLSFDSELGATRTRVAKALVQVSRSSSVGAQVLGLGPTQASELQHNVDLATSATMPAVERYTGVLYDAFDVSSFSAAERARASQRIAIGSALFGLLRADDSIPAYRLSGGSRLPRIGTLAAVWKPCLGPVLAHIAEHELIVDLRSGAYQALAPVSGAVAIRVLTEQPDGSRRVVSHFNKATKGLLARMLVRTTCECETVAEVARVARRGGMVVEQRDERSLDVITTTTTGK